MRKNLICYEAIFEKVDIEKQVSFDLSSDRVDDKKNYVCAYIDNLDFNSQDNYFELLNDIIDKVLGLKKMLRPYIVQKNCAQII